MANLYRCDRCNAEAPNGTGMWRTIKFAALGAGAVGNGIPAGGTDLCAGCVRQLEQWLQPIPAAAPESR